MVRGDEQKSVNPSSIDPRAHVMTPHGDTTVDTTMARGDEQKSKLPALGYLLGPFMLGFDDTMNKNEFFFLHAKLL